MSAPLTPMMRQYMDLKRQRPDAILFFRMGDFYEMFGEDAVTASKILNIALTTRDKGSESQVPMCGVPHHAVEGYLAKMIRSGYKVAVCDQMEDPRFAKGIVKREITRVVTPGAVMEPALLEDRSHNFLAAVAPGRRGFGLAAADVSTGLVWVMEFTGDNAIGDLENELDRLEARQILAPNSVNEISPPLARVLGAFGGVVDRVEDWTFDRETARSVLLERFRVANLDGFGLTEMDLATSAAGAVVHYLAETQKGAIAHLNRIVVKNPSDHMLLDQATRRNLELARNIMDGGREGSLLGLLDETVTPMGGRILKEWILAPLTGVTAIRERQETVRAFFENSPMMDSARETMTGLGDMERAVGRAAGPNCSPRDLLALKEALLRLPALRSALEPLETSIGSAWKSMWEEMGELAALLTRAVSPNAPAHARDGGVIREGYDQRLDELRSIQKDARGLILKLEEQERARSGIANLKIKYNRVFGYFFEVTRRQAESVPTEWMRKQSLVNAERFVSPALKELEDKIQNAEEHALDLELALFTDVRASVAQNVRQAQTMAVIAGEIDVYSTLAHVAKTRGYVEPVVDDSGVIEITAGRHPALERAGLTERFTPNDAYLDGESAMISIITGPNMAGKSTFIRQVALICLLAQTGAYVPADSARIGVCDRIFTRVGAQDHLQKGRSTFMVEMNETALILHNATARSLIVLDEIGRGTSTFDGISIAWAVAEHIHKIGARTLFATHYHELAELADSMPGVKNLSVAVREWNDEIIFLRKIVEGGADKSYGIQVARLAGLPREVITRAGEILTQLEANEIDADGHPKLKASGAQSQPVYQLSLFSPYTSEVEDELKILDVNTLTPIEALNKIAQWRKKLKG
jgi:DNA mismatch repair protein MutS